MTCSWSHLYSRNYNNDDIRSTPIVFTCSWYLSLTVKIHRKIHRISIAKNDIVCLEEIIIIAIYQLFFELEHVDFCVYFEFFCNLTIHTCYTIFCAGHHQLQSLELITLFLSNKCAYVGMCTNAEVTSWSRRVTISMNKDFVNAKKKMWATRNNIFDV